MVKQSDDRVRLQALSLAKDCREKILELLINATVVVDDAIQFVSIKKSR